MGQVWVCFRVARTPPQLQRVNIIWIKPALKFPLLWPLRLGMACNTVMVIEMVRETHEGLLTKSPFLKEKHEYG